jgi:hypothetical protein
MNFFYYWIYLGYYLLAALQYSELSSMLCGTQLSILMSLHIPAWGVTHAKVTYWLGIVHPTYPSINE